MSHPLSDKLESMRHSLAHLLASAVLEMFPEAKLGIGPVIEDGFYYDFELPRTLMPEDLPLLEQKMKEIIRANVSFLREEMPAEEALKLFEKIKQPYKTELINDLQVENTKTVSLYKTGPFVDLCRGPHIQTTKEIPSDSFKLTKIAGAYWKGSEKNKMLQRVYGVAFAQKSELKEYLEKLAEAEKRDHRKLGKELDLFITSELVGAGLPLWTPKGALIRNLLDEYVWKLREACGFQKVSIPHITRKELYEKSGHWQKFSDELFKIKSREGHEFALKPMSCPHHIQIFDRKLYSFRDLPVRYCETTMVYRDEQSGELGGISRVRGMTQDDSHVFCSKDQIEKEVLMIWDIIKKFYSTFKFDLRVRLSLHDPKNFEKYLGTPEIWKTAEGSLQSIAKHRSAEFEIGIGEAALYGPKIDFIAKDSLGRDWQVATIQLDFNQPERFDLNFINQKGQKERVVMIHCAIMGSLERFISVLIEHYTGAFPVWLSPIQVAILPVTTKHNAKAKQLAKIFEQENIRVFLDDAKESVGKKIRAASFQKIPYMIVFGDKEAKSNNLFIKERGKEKVSKTTRKAFIEKIKKEIEKKK
ncbi:threonine--tRNA ligase [Patescibacteria group bacterium]|nr:MAG: threonine--tRNA ligase [Patescibacteria group bacterium]